MTDALFERLQHMSAAALSGLLANPTILSQHYQQYLQAKKLTVEKLAILSASSILEELEKFRDAVNKDEQEKKLVLVEDQK